MTPQQLIDACRATNQPLPSGRKIAEVVERLVEENAALMAPPVVTDAMVERATSGIYTLWWHYNEAKMGRDTLARAVLEAALKE